ncbi:unnamed protein product [Cylicocyclus nassatus]|uniref:Zinc metalloproteinase n=1 Tax=Cylicocyclus nassatus TaxID=53992 RepID=A0AA36LZK9_CYLNA|nr:unnamed protein product [Cylicocyclus nassatus]
MHKRLHANEEKITKRLKLNPQRQAILHKIEKKLCQVEQVQPSPIGDIVTINENEGIGKLLFESDILLTERQMEEISNENGHGRKKRQAFKDKDYPQNLWPDGIVHFSFHNNTTNKLRDLFRHGALKWQRETCLSFYEYIHAPERIELKNDSGCWSYVGNAHKIQTLSLGEGCETIGTAAHEIGHALGFFHSHGRHDRDEHIQIDETKVKEFSSSFSADKTRLDTMIPLDRKYIDTIGSHFISFYDKLMMNTHYKCLDKCKSNKSAAKCAMGGFPNPKDCSKCVCPGGYGGTLCNERPTGCGEILQATTDYTKFEDVIGYPGIKGLNDNDFFLKCNYWIEVPLGRYVEIRFDNFTDLDAVGKSYVGGCYFAGFEIKAQKDQRTTGYRFCSRTYAGEVFKSAKNIVPIITYSRVWPVKTELRYRMV